MSSLTSCQAWLERDSSERYPIEGNCSIGRSPSNTVVLADEKISRRHAIVHAQGENEFWLVDLGSSNGTYLNGRRVTQPVQVHDKDSIQIGPFLLTFHQPQGGGREADQTLSERTIVDIRSTACWLLVADIEASTQLVQRLAPDQLPLVTGRWFFRCREIIEGHSGIINQYLGDGLFAFWPASPAVLPSVAGALRKLTVFQGEETLRFRVVLHHGLVSVGGSVKSGEERLSGKDVHFVFRMEKLAGVLGQARLMSEPAQSLLNALLPATEVGAHPLAGFEGQFRFFTF